MTTTSDDASRKAEADRNIVVQLARKVRKADAAARGMLGALVPRERITPAQWAERYRRLGPDETSTPGPYRFSTTPYWRFVMDLINRPGVSKVVCIKGFQIGWSELTRNVMGFWIDLHPGPIMVLCPEEKFSDDWKVDRLDKMMKNTPAVRQHVSRQRKHNTKRKAVFTNGATVFMAWAGSSSGTKSKPIQRLICEEPDEYKEHSGAGGDPLSKAEKRLATYRNTGRSSVLIGGTPTTRTGNVHQQWEQCGARFYLWLPCPHCNGYQRLYWRNVKYPDFGDDNRRTRADRILSERLAYYECEHCYALRKEPIRDHHKPAMLRRGVWAHEQQAVTIDGRVVGPEPKAASVGVFINSLYSPFVTFSEMAAEWLNAQVSPNKLADFVNQYLAEPFEQQRSKTSPDLIAAKSITAPKPMVIPRWAWLLYATADTQGDTAADGYFYYVIRAWGYGNRSQLIDYGAVKTTDELYERCLMRELPYDDGVLARPQLLLIDSGGKRTREVYEFSHRDGRIHPTKGASASRTFMVSELPQGKSKVVLWMVDTDQAKDMLHGLIHHEDKTLWLPHNEIVNLEAVKMGTPLDVAAAESNYCKQMAAESKIFDPKLNTERWVEIGGTGKNHYWDCEALQCAAAFKGGAGVPDPRAIPNTPGSAALETEPDLERVDPRTNYRRW